MDIQVHSSHFPYEENDVPLAFRCDCILTASPFVHKWYRVRALFEHVIAELDSAGQGKVRIVVVQESSPDESTTRRVASKHISEEEPATEQLLFPVDLHDLVVSQVTLALSAKGVPYLNRTEWTKLKPTDRKPNLSVALNALPHHVVSVLSSASAPLTEKPLEWSKVRERIGAAVYDSLYFFQRITALRAICEGGRLMLCDEMGLGKSKQVVACICVLSALAKQHKLLMSDGSESKAALATNGVPDGVGPVKRIKAKSLPALIVCPKGLKVNMCNELVTTLIEHPENLLGLDYDVVGRTPAERAEYIKSKAGELHKQPAILRRIAILNSGPEINKWAERKDPGFAKKKPAAKVKRQGKGKDKDKDKDKDKGKSKEASSSEQLKGDSKSAPLSVPEDDEEEDPCRFVITSFQLVEKLKTAMTTRGWFPETIAVDEAHSVKNWNTKQSLALLPLVKRARYRFMMSGTPMQNASEFYSIINAVRPDLFPNYFEYAKRYCVAVPTTFRGPDGRPKTVVKYVGCVRRSELHAILSGTIMVRRTKQQVLSQMPDLIRRCVYLPMVAAKKKKKAKTKEGETKTSKSKDKRELKEEKPSFLQEMHNTIKTKMPVVLEEFKNTVLSARADIPLSSRKKLVLFVHHRKLGVALCKLLAQFDVPHITVHGQGSWVWGPVAHAKLRESMQKAKAASKAVPKMGAHVSMDVASDSEDFDVSDNDDSKPTQDDDLSDSSSSSSSDGETNDNLSVEEIAAAAAAKKNKTKRELQLGVAYHKIRRDQAVHLFQTGSIADCEVAVLGLMAMRAGHTLTAANEAYMFELHPNPEVDMQAEARLHRIGQKEIVTVHYYLQLETTDPKIYQIVRDKVQATSHVLDGKQSDFAFASSSACKTEEKKSV